MVSKRIVGTRLAALKRPFASVRARFFSLSVGFPLSHPPHRPHNAKEQADSLVLQQQQVFEDTLARNDAAHDARLRRERAVAEEQAARRAEAVTSSVSAAVALSLSAQSQQAAAAVAVVAAAEASIMSEMQVKIRL